MLRTLSMYQDRMTEITRRAELNLAKGGETACTALGRDRTAMAQLMASYQLFMHREVFEPMSASRNPLEADRARSLKIECIALAGDFFQYTKYWRGKDVQSNWAEYVPQARAMIARIRSHARAVCVLAPPILAGKTVSNRSLYAA